MGRGARMAVKWLLAPVAAGALGYAFVGPRLAGHARLVRAVQERVGTIAPSIVPKAPEATPAEPAPHVEAPPSEPKVTVTAKPAEGAPPEDPPRRRRRRRQRAAPTDEAPPENEPSADREGPDPASTP